MPGVPPSWTFRELVGVPAQRIRRLLGHTLHAVARRSQARAGLAGLLALLALASCARPAPEPHPLAWGVFLPDWEANKEGYARVAEAAGARPTYVLRFAAIDDQVPTAALGELCSAGYQPVVSLEPWIMGGGVDQPDYAMARVAAGAHDEALNRWASGLRDVGCPVLLRFAHEMNGTWYPWAVGVNGNTAADYFAAWGHVHEVFRAANAASVRFIWAPNTPFPGSPDLASLYPGSDVVDLVGLDGYNWGEGEGRRWEDPEPLFGSALEQLRAAAPDRQILITEVGSAEAGDDGSSKAAWIEQFVDLAARSPEVIGFVWFSMSKERDWRLDSTPATRAAFAAALAGLPSQGPPGG